MDIPHLCPPGLEYLLPTSNLIVKQEVELAKVFMGYETKIRSKINNENGQTIYWAVEESDLSSRLCCGRLRPFQMTIVNATKREVIRLYRPLKCSACCFPCCLQTMEVYSPPGELIGTIEQVWSLIHPKFTIKNGAGETVLRIERRVRGTKRCAFVEFQVLSAMDAKFKVGKIRREWSGMAKDLLMGCGFFGISFLDDLDVKMKAVLIGAVFLIDSIHFERFNYIPVHKHTTSPASRT